MENLPIIIPTKATTTTLSLKIADYLQRFEGIEVGVYDHSPVSKVGHYGWEVRFYPLGKNNTCEAHASVELSLVSPDLSVFDPDKADFSKFRRLLKDDEDKSAFNKFLTTFKNTSKEELTYFEEDKAILTKIKIRMIENRSQDQIACSDEVVHTFYRSQKQLRLWCCPKFILKSVLDSLSKQGDGCFTILCDLTVFEDSPPLELPGHLERLLKEGLGADITFLVGGQEFPAHKYMLAARSSIFKEQFFGQMAEEGMSRMELKDVEPRVFEMLLHFIYTGFPLPCANARGCSVTETKQLRVLAERYDLKSLKEMCEKELEKKRPGACVESDYLHLSKKPKGI